MQLSVGEDSIRVDVQIGWGHRSPAPQSKFFSLFQVQVSIGLGVKRRHLAHVNSVSKDRREECAVGEEGTKII